MSQRDSGYERKERDLYETPAWVTFALIEKLPFMNERSIWEPACASGKMVDAMKARGLEVDGTDIAGDPSIDFLGCGACHCSAIITNPPYEKAQEFIWQALSLMRPNQGLVAMLLRTDFDHAKTRADLFAEHRAFAKKIVLTKRIRWFEDSAGSPSFNHAWFIWDWQHQGPPTLAYGP